MDVDESQSAFTSMSERDLPPRTPLWRVKTDTVSSGRRESTVRICSGSGRKLRQYFQIMDRGVKPTCPLLIAWLQSRQVMTWSSEIFQGSFSEWSSPMNRKSGLQRRPIMVVYYTDVCLGVTVIVILFFFPKEQCDHNAMKMLKLL